MVSRQPVTSDGSTGQSYPVFPMLLGEIKSGEL